MPGGAHGPGPSQVLSSVLSSVLGGSECGRVGVCGCGRGPMGRAGVRGGGGEGDAGQGAGLVRGVARRVGGRGPLKEGLISHSIDHHW